MSGMTDPKILVGRAIETRIADKGMTYKQVAANADVSVETLSKARKGVTISDLYMKRIMVALDWTPGSADQIAQGGNPTDAPPGPTLVSTGTPPVEQAEPALTLTGAPLEAGETLTGWDREDGRRHWRFERTENGETASITAAYPMSTPIDEVVRRMRTAASVALM